MSKDGRSCMLTSSPQSKTGLTLSDPTENTEIIHKIDSTQDRHDFTIGKRVYVGGTRPGVIAYIGETHFAPGDWVGIVLDDPSGKNDGCIAGKRYFQCDGKRGVFSRLNRLTLTQINDVKRHSTSELDFDMDRFRTTTITTNRRDPVVGDRVIVSSGLGSRLGELKFLGETDFAAGTWCGIQLDDPNGKNDGTVEGVKYFECLPKYGIFVPIAKVSLSPLSKKGNFSRMGSRESLTSVGTVNSVATTNTSRLRMNMLKRPSQNIILPPTPNKYSPKPTFSMQDIIREKQNYIEQLMTERELDREDVQNQNMRHQKELDEMKEKVSVLEIRLDNTKKKNEELKNIIDETTFCGDELNAQNQVFREKIIALENKLVELDPNAIASIDQKLVELEHVECKKCTDYLKQSLQLRNEVEKLVGELEIYKIQMKNAGSSDNLEIQLKEKNTKISDLESNISQLESDKEFLEIEFKKLKEESNEMMKIISQKDIETNQYRTILENLELKNYDLNSKIDKVTEININLETEILDLKNKIRNLNTESQVSQLNVVNSEILTHQVQELEENTSKTLQLENNIIRFKNDNEKLKAEIQTLMENTKEIQIIKDNESKEFENQLKILETENYTLKQRILEIEIKNKNLITKAKNNMTEINTQKQQININTENNKINKKKYSELELMLKNLQDDLIKKEADMEESRTRNAEFEKKIADIENQKYLLEIKLQNFEKNKSEMLTNKNKIKSDGEKCKNLEIKNAELIKKVQETEMINKNIAMDLEVNAVELSNLKVQLNSITENKNIDIQKFSALELLHENLKVVVNDKEKQLLESRTKINELEKIIDLLKIEKEISIKSLERVKEDCIRIKTSMCEESIEYNKKLENLEAKNNEIEVNISELSKTKEMLELNMVNLTKKYHTQKSEFAILVSSRENEMKITDNLSKNLTEIEFQLKEVTRKNYELQFQLDQTKVEKQLLEHNFQKLTEDSKNMKKLNEEKTTESNEFKYMSESLQNKCSELNCNLRKTVDKNKNLELEIQRLSAQLNDLSCALNSKETQNIELNQFTVLHKIIQEENIQKEIQLNDKNLKIAELEENIAQLKNEKVDLQNHSHKMQDHLLEFEKLNIVKINDYKLKLDEQNSAFQLKLIENAEANNRLLDEIKNMESKLLSTLATKELQNRELNSLQEAHKNDQEIINHKDTQINEKIEIISNLEIEVIQLKKVKDNLRKDNQKLRDELDHNQDSQLKDINELTEKLKVSVQNYNDLLNTILEKTEIIKDNEQQIQINLLSLESKSQEIENYKLTFDKMVNDNNELKEKIKEINDVNQQLTTKLKNQEHKFAEFQHNIIQNETEINEKEIRISELEKIITEERIRNVSLINDFEELKQNSNSSLQESAELKVKLTELEDHSNNITETNKILVTDSEILTTQMQIQNSEIEKSTNKIEELTTEICELQIKFTETNELLLKINTDYDKLQSEHQNMETIIKSLTHKYEKELNIEKSEIETADNSVYKIRQEFDKLLENNEKLNLVNEQHKKIIDLKEEQKQDAINNAEMLQIESDQVLAQLKDHNNQYKKKLENLNQEILLKDREILHSRNVIELTNKELKDRIIVISKLENEISKFKSSIYVKIPHSMEKGDSNDSVEQINFLNSIIADMHEKNESLISRIAALESPAPMNFLDSSALDILYKRKPAPRLFCDICDEFDAHDTEDCPIQASDDSRPNSSLLPNPKKINSAHRKYCESCEEFGHETDECPNGECF